MRSVNVRRLMCSVSLLSLVITIDLAASGVAQATTESTITQPAAASESARDGSSTLSEVVVTAQKRQENLQTTPISASVLNSKALRDNVINQINDLQRATPSLSVSDNGITQYVNIRGIGLSVSAPGVSNGVAYFVDGLFLPSAPLYETDPYFDLARVEVLRGPQGTLVGQSSTGGAIYVVSQVPKLGVLSADLEQTFGNFSEYRTQGALNVPLGRKWAARLAFQVEDRDSFFTRVGSTNSADSGRTPGDLTRYAGRLGVFGELTDRIDVTLRSEFQIRHSGGTTGKPIPGDAASDQYVLAAPSRPYDLNFDAQTYDDLTETENSLEINWRITDGIRLRSLSGITTGKRHFAQDTDGSSAAGSTRLTDIHETNYSQEFNLVSTNHSRFQWVAGVFDIYQDLGGGNVLASEGPPFTPAEPAITIAHSTFGNESLGVFGQATYDLTSRLQLLTGLRYSYDRTASFGGSYTIQGGRQHPQVGHESSDALTGKVAVNFKLTPDEFTYVSASRGYKAGGFNSATSTFAPEFVWDYEGGLKSTLLGGHLRTQVDVYYNDYSSIQVPVYDTFLAFSDVANGTSAKVYGVEAQGEARFGSLGLNASLAYNHSRLDSITLINPALLPLAGAVPLCSFGPGPCTFDFGPATVNLQGRTLPYAPTWTANFGAEYGFQLPTGRLTPRINVSYQGRQLATLFGDVPVDVIASRTLVDALLTFQSTEHWRLQAYATNLFDRTYVAGKFNDLQYFSAPRQFGLRIGYSY